MRLMMVTRDLPPRVGGIQTYALEMARRLAASCDEFAVIAPNTHGAKEADSRHSFRVVRVPGPHDAFPLSSVPAQRHVASKLRPDAVFYTHWGAAAYGAWACPGVAAFVAAHGRELLIEPWQAIPRAGAAYVRRRRQVLTSAAGVFPVSAYTGRFVEEVGVSAERIHVVPNGTDPVRFAPRDGASLRRELGLVDRQIVLTVGRLVARKNTRLLVEAFGSLRERHPRAVLLVVGEGPERARLEATAQRSGIAESVRFAGAASDADLPRFYNAADVFASPIVSDPPDVEGFGLVFLEASSSGVPVVGPDRGGPREAIVPQITGFCVDPTSRDAVAGAISELLAAPDRARALGVAGRARVLEQGTWDHAADRLVDAMKRSVHRGRAAA